MRVGETVFAIGNPHDLGWTHTQGVISQFRTRTYDSRRIRVIQTQAAINPGNSGGGLYDTEGYCLGINTWTADKSISEGIGFAIALDTLSDLAPPPLAGVTENTAETEARARAKAAGTGPPAAAPAPAAAPRRPRLRRGRSGPIEALGTTGNPSHRDRTASATVSTTRNRQRPEDRTDDEHGSAEAAPGRLREDAGLRQPASPPATDPGRRRAAGAIPARVSHPQPASDRRRPVDGQEPHGRDHAAAELPADAAAVPDAHADLPPQHRAPCHLHRRPLEPRRAALVDRGADRRDDRLPELQHQEPAQRRGGAMGQPARQRVAAGPGEHDARRSRGGPGEGARRCRGMARARRVGEAAGRAASRRAAADAGRPRPSPPPPPRPGTRRPPRPSAGSPARIAARSPDGGPRSPASSCDAPAARPYSDAPCEADHAPGSTDSRRFRRDGRPARSGWPRRAR